MSGGQFGPWAAGLWTLASMLLIAALAPLMEGLIRKLRARVHSRQGPPITQPYLDLAKLLIKEDLRVSPSVLLRMGPLVFLAATLLAGGLIPLWPGADQSYGGDVIVFAYLLALATGSVIITGMASRSPFSVVGASRETVMMVGTEPTLVLSLLVVAVNAGSLRFDDLAGFQLQPGTELSAVLAAIAYALALQALVSRIPFDIAEAESELMGGPFTELSGPSLAVCKLALFCKPMVFSLLFVQVFLPWLWAYAPWVWLQPIVALAAVFVINLGAVGLIDVLNPRLRVDQAVSYLATVGVIAVTAMAYAALAGG